MTTNIRVATTRHYVIEAPAASAAVGISGKRRLYAATHRFAVVMSKLPVSAMAPGHSDSDTERSRDTRASASACSGAATAAARNAAVRGGGGCPPGGRGDLANTRNAIPTETSK